MVTELDIWAIKERIVAVLQADTDIYDSTPSAKTKLRKIITGRPNGPITNEPCPYAYVTNSRRLQTITRKGNVISNAWKSLDHHVRFDIVIFVEEKGSEKAEEAIDDFEKLILETLEENNQLKNPTTGLDPKVNTSWPESSEFTRQEFDGRFLQSKTITLSCIVTTG